MVEQTALPGLEVASKEMVDPKHAEEKRIFEAMLAGSALPWVGDYLALLDEGWYWRDACFIAWKGTPKAYREPSSQEALADLMGFTGRTLKNRLAKNPAIRLRAAKQASARVMEKVDEVVDALMESASNSNYKNHPDRKLALEMAGLYTPKQGIELGQMGHDVDDLSNLSKDELARLAGVTVEADDSE